MCGGYAEGGVVSRYYKEVFDVIQTLVDTRTINPFVEKETFIKESLAILEKECVDSAVHKSCEKCAVRQLCNFTGILSAGLKGSIVWQ